MLQGVLLHRSFNSRGRDGKGVDKWFHLFSMQFSAQDEQAVLLPVKAHVVRVQCKCIKPQIQLLV